MNLKEYIKENKKDILIEGLFSSLVSSLGSVISFIPGMRPVGLATMTAGRVVPLLAQLVGFKEKNPNLPEAQKKELDKAIADANRVTEAIRQKNSMK